ncbi:hypothetical protein TWF192_008833 [Orbilia oligospora]|uniref:NYN domain-containing protein n=1 Tax=Orbilia oligospora TaxID=2813651 RepID=A0A6G1M2Q0_ORBOL|nr:hypothetical protein TWF679_010700 [Orbilia oligospora]KAF3226215.1 hypothetical protein TWF191_004876 [Orbilia oligospora]KAF3241820.1 hypothetical protein TWF192_008833 [Orbilia oligospora]
MDRAHNALPSEERNPFDLSCAIDLLRSLSWYHPTSNSSDSTITTTTTTTTTSATTSATSTSTITTANISSKSKRVHDTSTLAASNDTTTLLLHQDSGRRNPFLDILSSDGPSSSVVGKKTKKNNDEAVAPPKNNTARKLGHSKTPSMSSIPKQSRKRSPVKETAVAVAALSAIQRRTGFLQSLKELDKGKKAPLNPAVHVFVDYSNISIGFYDSVKKLLSDTKKSSRPPQIQHISFKTLSLILERGRPATKKVLVGSTQNNDLKSEAQDLNYEVSILQRVPRENQDSSATSKPSSRGYASEPEQSRKRTGEQAVDEVLIMKILESLVDCCPSTIVLATGDGNITQFSDGFYKAVERALEKGWNVELVAFKRTISKSWKKLVCPEFRIILLDGFLPDLLQ